MLVVNRNKANLACILANTQRPSNSFIMFNEQGFAAWLPNHHVIGNSVESYLNSLRKIELIGNVNITQWVPANTQGLIDHVEGDTVYTNARRTKTLENYSSAVRKYHEFITGVPFN